MQRVSLSPPAVVALGGFALAASVRADDTIKAAHAPAFDTRAFAKSLGQKTYACFTRLYDADHLARHSKKVAAMQLPLTAEMPAGESAGSYSFRFGVNDRDRPGDFDSSGSCEHARAEDAGHEIRYT